MQNNKLSELIEIIEKSNVSSIISDYISLEKKGSNHMGLCPFHPDSNPSMSVSDQKGIFKCFVCGAGGNAISFVQNYEGITFIEAVKKVSEKLGIDWKQYINFREVKINPKIKRGWEINEEALNFFKYNLNNTNNPKVLEYIKTRGLTSDILDKYDIGFSGEGLSNFLLNKEFTEEEIVTYGLAKRKEDTTLQDYFINRLIFSIKDKNGNIVGFSGRVIEESKYAKYMNSPENPVFKKSSILYNLDKAKTQANLKKELIIVEGFMDVIALGKAGIENAIATMGTAFTNDHNKIIESITNNIILAFDSDVAGINAAISTSKTLVQGKNKVSIVTVPNGKDFDEILSLGKEKVIETLNNKKDFLLFYKEMIFNKLGNSYSVEQFDVIRELLKVISFYDDNLVTDVNINEISEKLNISKEVLMEEFSKFKKKDNNPFLKEDIPVNREQKILEKATSNIKREEPRFMKKIWLANTADEIVSYAIMYDFAFDYLKNHTIIIDNDDTRKLWRSYLENKINNVEITDEILLSRIENLVQKAKQNIANNEIQEIHNKKTFEEFIRNYENQLSEFRLELLNAEMKNATDIEERGFIFDMINNLSKNNKV